MPLLSAHRCGAEGNLALENTREALERAATLASEFVEFDVQRCVDGVFVLYHDDHVQVAGDLVPLSGLTFAELSAATQQLVRYEDALAILAGRRRAHIDFKFFSPRELYAVPERTFEVAATQIAIDVMGAGAIIVTSLEDASVRAIRAWSRSRHPALLVGLSLGRDLTGRRVPEVVSTRASELFPTERIIACDANLVVANKSLARATLARFAHRRDLPLLIWTVDEPDELRRWLMDRRTWMVTTNYPLLAAELRERWPQRPPRRRRLRTSTLPRGQAHLPRGTNRRRPKRRRSSDRGRRLDR